MLGALAAICIAGCGGSGHAKKSASTLSAARAPVSTAPRKPATPPRLLALRAAIDRALRHAGSQTGIYVYDISSGATLYALRDATARPPASVEKLYTTVALASKLSLKTHFDTAVRGTGHLGPGGVWEGDLYLRGGGDPTFGDGTFNRYWEMGFGPTAAQLAGQLRAAGIGAVSGRLYGDESLFDSLRGGPANGFAPDVPDFGGQLSALTYDHGAATGLPTPAAFAAHELALTLRAQHVHVRAASTTALTPDSARTLATVSSPPLAVLLKLMDVPSDDLFAELLTKQLGVRFGGAGSTVAGASVITNVISSYGLRPRIVDGSGLSRADQSTPRDVVSLLRKVWRTDVGRTLASSLPVVGVNGTVAGLAHGTAAQGRCIAKTGTLTAVTNLAGYCGSRGRDTVAFALFIDGPPNAAAFVMLSRIVTAIARY